MTPDARSSPHEVISASAGSGKTYQLTRRYLRLLMAGESPSGILATTFTRKAAAEIIDRVLSDLALAVDSDDHRNELAEKLKQQLSRDEILVCLEKMVADLHRLQICTLDSFFSRVATSFQLELGLPPGWRISEESEAGSIRSEAVQQLLASGRRDDLLTIIRHLSKGDVKRSVHDQILALVRELHGMYQDTPAAAWEALPRPQILSGEEFEGLLAELDAIPKDLKRLKTAGKKLIDLAGAENWPKLAQDGLLKKAHFGETFHGEEIDPAVASTLQRLLRHAVHSELQRFASQTRAARDLLERYDEVHRNIIRRRRSLQFDDITRALARAGLTDHAEDIYFRLDSRVSHLMLDEFQDTSLVQWRVLEPMAEEILSHGDGSRSFFCVGDVKQAIYGWRGGTPDILLQIAQHPNVVTEPLNKSFRSSQVIIDSVNAVFESLNSNSGMSDKHLAAVASWHRDFATHTTARSELRGFAELRTSPEAAEDQNQGAVTCRYAAGLVKGLLDEAPDQSVGILVRVNQTVARMIFELRQLGISASEEGGVRLTSSPLVMALLSLVRLADHPSDSIRKFHVATSPLGKLIGLQEHSSSRFVSRLASEIRSSLLSSYGDTVSGWVKMLAPISDAASFRRLERLREAAHEYDARATLRPEDFANYIESLRVEEPSSSMVRVMTFHQSKGLQFDQVVLPELGGRLVGQAPDLLTRRPDSLSPIDLVSPYVSHDFCRLVPDLEPLHDQYLEQRIRDSLSLLYVGMTRAVHSLHMIVAPKKPQRGTFAAVLEAALANSPVTDPETSLFELGQGDWQRAADKDSPPGPEREDDSASVIKPPRLAQSAHKKITRKESASSLEGGTTLRLRDRFRIDGDDSMRRGTIIHRLFECVGWIEDGAPDDDELMSAVRPLAEEAICRKSIQEFRAMLAGENVRGALSRGTYLPPDENASLRLERERSFAMLDGDRLLTGTLDRLVIVEQGDKSGPSEFAGSACVIDYKTDAIDDQAPERSIENRVAHYRPQIEAYKKAAARVTRLPIEAITARLIFLAVDRVESVD